MRVEGFSRARCDTVNARDSGLRKRGRCARNRRVVAIGSDAESIGDSGIGRPAHTSHKVLAALDSLDQAGTQQRHEDKVHAVQTSIDSAIATTDNALATAEHLAQDSVRVVGIPSCGNPRAERTVEGVIGILLARSRVANKSEANLRVVNLASQS